MSLEKNGNRRTLGLQERELVYVEYEGGGRVLETPLVAEKAIERGFARKISPSGASAQKQD